MDDLYEKIIVKNIFYELVCWGSEWLDKNIFDGININLSRLTSRLSLRSLGLQDGQIHTYSLAMIMFASIAIFIMILVG